MRNRFKLLYAVCLTLLLVGIANLAAQGFSISGRKLMDANGNEFIMRGINHAHCWYTDKSNSAIPDIKSVGANCVRIVCANGCQWTKTSSSELSTLISLCKSNKLIAIPEVHDATGHGEQTDCHMSGAVTYWNEMKSVLQGEEAYVIINIANEPWGNNNYNDWTAATKSAIQSMRNNGFEHTLMVDAPCWGQDWAFVMRDNAQSVFDSDPDKNTILSVHMYGVYDTDQEINDYMSTFVNNGIPLVVGEFGHNHSDGDPDEGAIMSRAKQYGIGFIGWSWCGNSSEVSYLDIVNNWDKNSLTSWGNTLVSGLSAQECSVFSGTVTDNEPPVITLLGDNPMYLTVGEDYIEPGATATDNKDGDVTSSMVITGNVDTDIVDSYTITYRVSDAAGNEATATRTVNVEAAPDYESPVITLLGDNPMTIFVNDSYDEPGATATDDVDGDLTDDIQTTGTVQTWTEGTYTITYTVSDAAGNETTEERTVIVEPAVSILPFSGAMEQHHVCGNVKAAGRESIRFSLSHPQNVSLNILNTQGVKLATYFSEYLSEGAHCITFPKNYLSRGVYIVMLKGNNINVRKKLVKLENNN